MEFESGQFDLSELSCQIDWARARRDASRTAISKEVGAATSTIRRFARASDAEADGVLALVGWLGVAPEQFVVNSKVAGVSLPPAGEGVIRIGTSRIIESPSWPSQTAKGTRTTTLRLAQAAQLSETTMTSLTRWSPV